MPTTTIDVGGSLLGNTQNTAYAPSGDVSLDGSGTAAAPNCWRR